MILIIQNRLLHYRRDLLNALSLTDDVVVVHSGDRIGCDTDKFQELVIPKISFGPFQFQMGLCRIVAEQRPSVVIAMFDIRWINSIIAMYRFDRQLTWIWWGLDKGKSSLATRVKMLIARRPNAIIFYTTLARDFFSKFLKQKDRLIVANNTFHVPERIESFRNSVKCRFINVGSLDARKQNDIVIRVLKKIRADTGTEIRYTLIGDGTERGRLEALVQELGMDDCVEFLGKIEDSYTLGRYYSGAIASVSFGQAGLAVLQSMAHGVPFVTKRNAISGGEISNIHDGIDGVLCEDDPADLERILRDLIENPQKARNLGRAAYAHYTAHATLERMLDNFRMAMAYQGKQK